MKTNNVATATSKRIKFTTEETEAIRRAARAVWDEVGYDCLQAVADDKGKDINAVTVSRAVVIEIALDAGRAEEMLRSQQRRDEKAGRPAVITDDFFTRLQAATYKQLIALVRPAFTYTRYGM